MLLARRAREIKSFSERLLAWQRTSYQLIRQVDPPKRTLRRVYSIFRADDYSCLKVQMKRHLDESRAADRMLDDPKASMGRERITRGRIETRVEGNVVVGRVEARSVEDIEEVNAILQSEPLT